MRKSGHLRPGRGLASEGVSLEVGKRAFLLKLSSLYLISDQVIAVKGESNGEGNHLNRRGTVSFHEPPGISKLICDAEGN